jgi:tetratricopeptide (TPR) repeat protein
VVDKMKNEGESKAEFKAWRTFSIFISSTFSDMQAERDYLKANIFPKVEEELRNRRIKLEIVDLRWGVDTTSIAKEDEREATVLKVCLDEIKRCRPFFIGLLGDRYGWIPSEERMENAVTGETGIKPGKNKSVTALEIEFGVFAGQKQLSRCVFYFRDPFDYSKFSKAKAARYSDEFDTELTDIEKQQRIYALKTLKLNIKKHFKKEGEKNKVKTYSAKWDEVKEKVTGLKKFGKLIYKDILEECKIHAAKTWDKVPKDEHEKEIIRLEAFVEDHIDIFCGREELISRVKLHLLAQGNDKWGMILTGESGSGKSAVFSKIYKEMQKDDCFILAHSAGLSPASCKVHDLLLKWNRQLREFLGIAEEPKIEDERLEALSPDVFEKSENQPKLEIEKQIEKFKELLFAAADKKQIVLLIDALDRFEPTERAKYMTWLPEAIPGNIRMLCTSITGTENKATGYNKGLFSESIEYFSESDARKMLNALSQQKHKTLPDKVIEAIFFHKREDGQLSVSSPLWLSLVVNMLTALDSDDFEKMSSLEGRGDQQIERYITQMVAAFPDLPGDLFIDLIQKAGKVFGETFTQIVLDLIACSRNGLRESDLEKLVPEIEKINWNPLLFAGIRRWFKGHLREQGDNRQWNLAHSILRSSLQNRLAEDEFKNIHNVIASHLLNLSGIDDLRISESMFHLMQADNAQKGLEYYTSWLSPAENDGATNAIAEAIASDNIDKEWFSSVLKASEHDGDKTWRLATRLIFDLNNSSKIEGNLKSRINFLEKLKSHLLETPSFYYKFNINWGYDILSLYLNLGNIYQTQGNFDQAIRHFNECLKLLKEFCDINPQNEDLKHIQAISYQYLGSIYQSLGNLDQSLELYKDYNRLKKELYESNPMNESLKDGLAISYEKLGSIYQSQGKLDQAWKYYYKDIKLTIELYISNPQNEDRKNRLAISYSKLGEIYFYQRDFDQTLHFYNEFNRLMKELYTTNPQKEDHKYGLAISYQHLGVFYQETESFNEALRFYNEYNKLMIELNEVNPQNVFYYQELGMSYYNLSMISKTIGDDQGGRENFAKWKKMIVFLTEKFPQVLNYQQWNILEYTTQESNECYQNGPTEGNIFINQIKLGKEHYKKGNWKQAELILMKIMQMGYIIEGIEFKIANCLLNSDNFTVIEEKRVKNLIKQMRTKGDIEYADEIKVKYEDKLNAIKSQQLSQAITSAEDYFNRHLWEAAENEYNRLIEAGRGDDDILYRLCVCKINAHIQLSDPTLRYVTTQINIFEQSSNIEQANKLKQLLEKKNPIPKKTIFDIFKTKKIKS